MGEINKNATRPHEVALKLMILAGARVSEVRLMEKRDLNLKKAGQTVLKDKRKTHCKTPRPLASQALIATKWIKVSAKL